MVVIITTAIWNHPTITDYITAGSGAYGPQPGNVTIVAGGNVTGHYLVANGIGGIYAGVQMDANGNPVNDASGNYVLDAVPAAPGTKRTIRTWR